MSAYDSEDYLGSWFDSYTTSNDTGTVDTTTYDWGNGWDTRNDTMASFSSNSANYIPEYSANWNSDFHPLSDAKMSPTEKALAAGDYNSNKQGTPSQHIINDDESKKGDINKNPTFASLMGGILSNKNALGAGATLAAAGLAYLGGNKKAAQEKEAAEELLKFKREELAQQDRHYLASKVGGLATLTSVPSVAAVQLPKKSGLINGGAFA